MKPTEIFSSHIYGESFLGLNVNYLNQLKASIELMRRGNIEGRMVSNVEFGWQSDGLPQSGPFEKLTQEITKKAHLFCSNLENFKFTKIEMEILWANLNYKGDINWPHNHSGDISGVYYIDTHNNCGNLILDSYSYNQHNKLSSYHLNKHGKTIVPKNDKIVFFDSNCMHRVTRNMSDKVRVSVSFNLRIDV